LVLVFKWSIWDSKEGHWANGVCVLNKVIKFSDMDTTLSQGKVAAIWIELSVDGVGLRKEIGEEKYRQRST
jgi:hypothetical protein